jgi:hypothetical protein
MQAKMLVRPLVRFDASSGSEVPRAIEERKTSQESGILGPEINGKWA